jgi:hypothetical protein
MEDFPMSAKKKKKPQSHKKTAKKQTKPNTTLVKPLEETMPPLVFPQLSSASIARILSGFMKFRSTVKDLSQSIQRVENVMDHAYQMFEIATKMMAHAKQRGGFPALPGEKRPPSTLDQDIPVINLPFDNDPPNGSPGQQTPFQLGNILSLLQSPLIQRFIASLFRPSQPTAASYKKREG